MVDRITLLLEAAEYLEEATLSRNVIPSPDCRTIFGFESEVDAGQLSMIIVDAGRNRIVRQVL